MYLLSHHSFASLLTLYVDPITKTQNKTKKKQVTSLMSALGGEESLLGHVFLMSDRHSIPVNYPTSFYKASNWEGRLLQANPDITGESQLRHAFSGSVAAHYARSQSHAAIQFDVRCIVREDEAALVQLIYQACMHEG